MKDRFKVSILCVASALAGLTRAQSSIPRMPDGKPNLNGVWQHPYVPDMSKDGKDQKGAGELPFTPWGADNFKNYDPAKFDYTGHCLPFGLMRSINVGGLSHPDRADTTSTWRCCSSRTPGFT